MKKIERTSDKNIYTDKNLLKDFLGLVSERLSCSNDNKIYIKVKKLLDVFRIDCDVFEVAMQELAQVLKNVEIENTGIKALEAISCWPNFPENEKSVSIDDLADCDPSLHGILFKVDSQKFQRALQSQTNGEKVKTTEKQFKKSVGKEEEPSPIEKTEKELFFDPDKSLLIINGQQIKIRKFSDQYHLLRILFEEKLKDWQFSEIAELIDSEKAFKWKNLYNSANEIKKKIAIETSIKDFFITTTQSIKINEEYLEKS